MEQYIWWIPLVIVGVLFILLIIYIIRSTSKRQRLHEELLEELAKAILVQMSGGHFEGNATEPTRENTGAEDSTSIQSE